MAKAGHSTNLHRALARLMTCVRTPVAMLLVALWFPITAHCQLESMGVLPVLVHCDQDCSTDGDSPKTDLDGCGVLESASYRIDEACHVLPTIDAAISFCRADDRFVTPAQITRFPPGAGPSPPFLAASWRFVCRVAPSPRAPSLN
jgi:hypothetical protein